MDSVEDKFYEISNEAEDAVEEVDHFVQQYKNVTLIALLGVAILILWVISIPVVSSSLVIVTLLTALLIYTTISLYHCQKKLKEKQSSKENFMFEVSPNRKLCMEEKVSQEQPPATRSPSCCSVTERGAKLPFIEEWKKEGWARTDNWVDSPDNNTFQTQLPPTSFV